MRIKEIPALFMRGGTSKALVFRIEDLPQDTEKWAEIFLRAMGSPDPNGRQLNGMGGGISSLSKVCVIGPSTRLDADVDFTFAQISVDKQLVDFAGNCGNMISAMGPAALDLGYFEMLTEGQAEIRIHNTNTGKIIISQFPAKYGRMDDEGTMAIDGVAGTSAAIRLEFLNPGGTKTGLLLPTHLAIDELILPNGNVIQASLIDAANPCVFVNAKAMGKLGIESPSDLAADLSFMSVMEDIRCAGSVKMGMSPNITRAAQQASIPKVALVAAPSTSISISGEKILANDVSIVVRMISMEQPHRAIPITGAICVAIAARIPGSIPNQICQAEDGPMTIGHPSGSILVDAKVEQNDNITDAVSGTVYRTARKLFSGSVFY